MKHTLIALCGALCASVGFGAQGDVRYQYWDTPTTATTAHWTPPGTPAVVYHDGTLGGISGKPLGNSLTLVSGSLEANWTHLVGKPANVSTFTNDAGYLTSAAIPSRSFGNTARTLNSAFQPSSTRDALVSYSVDVSTSATLLGGQTGTVFLEYANDSGFTSGVTEVARFVNGNTVSLAIAITVTQNVTGTLTGVIPAGKYVRLRTANTVGSPTFNWRSGQEVLL